MPDYNPAVATSIAPPQPNTGMISSLTQIQEMQARSALVNLQALQQQREYNALQAASQAMQAGEDGGQAYIRAGGQNANYPGALQNYTATKSAIGAAGGVLPAQRGELLGAQKTAAEIPGAIAESQTKQIGVGKARTEADAATAKQYGPAVLVNPADDGAWRQLVNGHFDAVGGSQIERQAALNIKDPNQRMDGAIRYGAAAGVPVQDLAKTFNVGGSQSAQSQPGQQPVQGAAPQANVSLKQPGEVKQAEEQAGYFNKLYSGLSAAANTSATAKSDISIAKAAINDPNFYSGTGEGWNLMLKKAATIPGFNPTGALPQEVFRKVMAQNVLQQVNGLRAAQEEMGNAGGRIFQSQIDLMEKAAQNPDNTIPSNRFLTELADRSANLNTKLGDMADNYKGGKLDATFQKQMRDYVTQHPLISSWEASHLDTVGAPMADKLKQIDPREIQHLKGNPKNAAKFDAYYGPGTSKAALNQ